MLFEGCFIQVKYEKFIFIIFLGYDQNNLSVNIFMLIHIDLKNARCKLSILKNLTKILVSFDYIEQIK